ncbi:MAG: hypothetical protein DYH13_10365 [Alphaproteobacteria bacterium PRO2]|nr:hypothetical protein [Alphaproteobacteria bacterium PRO2]
MQADSPEAEKSQRTVIAMRHGGYDISGLTEQGAKEVERTGVTLRDKFNIEKILTTPELRGVQSANIVSNLHGGRVAVFPVKALGQSADFTDIMTMLHELPDGVREVLLVTHEFQINAIAIRLLGEEMAVSTGDAVKMSFNANSWLELKPGMVKSLATIDKDGAKELAIGSDLS